jgi:hypothetical protein
VSSETDARYAAVKTIPQVRDVLTSELTSLVNAADALVAKIERVGQPAVKDGDVVQRDLLAALRDNRSSMDGLRNAASGLPVTTPETFTKAAEELGKRADANASGAGKPVEDALKQFKVTSDTRKAIERDPDCKAMEARP